MTHSCYSLPDYYGGSIANLMSSLVQAFGGTSMYQPLTLLPVDQLTDRQHVVLIVLDGFGYEYLIRQHHLQTVLHEHLKGSITSVFPSTTASGITTFLTGLAPQQHAVTGWFMHLKEFGSVATSLLFQTRCNQASLNNNGFGADAIYGYQPIFRHINRSVYSVHHQRIHNAEYNRKMNQIPHKLSYRTITGFFQHIKKIIRSRHQETFTYAYWSEFDTLCHEHGTQSDEVTAHFQALTRHIAALKHAAANTDTMIIITADHGHIDTEPEKIIEVKHHPELRETLVLPLCGEPRVAYCYVRPSRTHQFERYISTHLDDVCDLYRSEELIAQHYFGLFEPEPRLVDRIGDYVLIMKENHIIKDFVFGETEKFHIGNHGGVSKEEMLVPLIVIESL